MIKISGINTKLFLECVNNALKGKIVLYATPMGNIAIIKWEEYERLKKYEQAIPATTNRKLS